MMSKILIVEDEVAIADLEKDYLELSDFQVDIRNTGDEGLKAALEGDYDLIILDLGLPDKDGMTLLSYVRKDSLTPIIVLSARSDERDKVKALDKGANDYITKPFGSAELLARIRSTLRITRQGADSGKLPGGKFVLQDLIIDYDARQIFINGEEIRLTQTEYNIVALLSGHCGKMMTYSSIIKAIWGYPDEGSIKKLQVNMANIRKKFGVKPGEAKYITNELGVGYRMNGDS